MTASAVRVSRSERVKPAAIPVLLAVIAVVAVTLILAFLFVKGRKTAPAGQREERRSSTAKAVSAAKAQKPSPIRLMDVRSARAARARMRVKPASSVAVVQPEVTTDDVDAAPVSNASCGRIAAGAQ